MQTFGVRQREIQGGKPRAWYWVTIRTGEPYWSPNPLSAKMMADNQPAGYGDGESLRVGYETQAVEVPPNGKVADAVLLA
jgi:hypothetical protein